LRDDAAHCNAPTHECIAPAASECACPANVANDIAFAAARTDKTRCQITFDDSYVTLRSVLPIGIESESNWSVVTCSVINMAAMKALCFIVALQSLSHCVNMLQMNKDEYFRLRNSMLHKEYQMRIGSKIKLTDKELRVNATLMKLKAKELEAARNNITNFPPAVHFFRAKPLIDNSDVFRIIRNMPKGTLMASTVYTQRPCTVYNCAAA